jgi:hypothetical protein
VRLQPIQEQFQRHGGGLARRDCGGSGRRRRRLPTVFLMDEGDMSDRGLHEFDVVDIASFSKDGTVRGIQRGRRMTLS